MVFAPSGSATAGFDTPRRSHTVRLRERVFNHTRPCKHRQAHFKIIMEGLKLPAGEVYGYTEAATESSAFIA
jgi:NADH:ubiquinone oxidoreductase subunit D